MALTTAPALTTREQMVADSGNLLSSPDGPSSNVVAEILSSTLTPQSPADILAAAQVKHFVIQDFCPLAESIEWELGQLYWNERGSRAFIGGDVPFAINNDGNLSVNAAEVFFVSLAQAEQEGRLEPKIFALEMGFGVGLFARYFLDAFRQLCSKHNKDYYERFCYVATDRSERMLADIARHEILSNHRDHYQVRLTDEAHQAFLRAVDLNPENVRARYNLIYTFARHNDYASALRVIAEGLLHDKMGEYRQRLLEKQSEILGRLTQLRQQETRLLADRFSTIVRPTDTSAITK